MTQRPAALASRRVVVVTTSLSPAANDLWESVRPCVRNLVLIGAGDRTVAARPGVVALREMDGGKGLIWRHLIGLRRYLKQTRPDLIHVNGELWGVTAQELIALPTRVVVHGAENLWEHGGSLESAIRRRLVRRAVDHIAGYASWNHDGAQYVQRLASGRGRALPTVAVPAVIPPETFRTTVWRAPPLEPGTELRLLAVGRLVWEKGFQDVLAAAATLAGRPVKVSICGTGPMASELREQASRLGVDLQLLGHVPDERLAAVMSSSHLMVQPSLTTSTWAEQFGRTVAEAMAVGVPCLVSDSGELPRLVENHEPSIFPEGDVARLAERIAVATTSSKSLASLADSQTSSARQYFPEVAGERVTAFWREALE